ncbi:hypothetical protein ROR02_30800 [Pararhodospirillum oryzae]|uniref:SPOR domain-containing protein n=1 Tax=Pararhodospirillum oryzae TaxID=478448 RepID=A0A512HBX3_9PROT|nr:hypothetical protein ROR02_30800 [Pararhodospirillum oryzae]
MFRDGVLLGAGALALAVWATGPAGVLAGQGPPLAAQLGAYEGTERARLAWSLYLAKGGAPGPGPVYCPTAGGRMIRILLPVSVVEEAQAACQAAREAGLDCLVVDAPPCARADTASASRAGDRPKSRAFRPSPPPPVVAGTPAPTPSNLPASAASAGPVPAPPSTPSNPPPPAAASAAAPIASTPATLFEGPAAETGLPVTVPATAAPVVAVPVVAAPVAAAPASAAVERSPAGQAPGSAAAPPPARQPGAAASVPGPDPSPPAVASPAPVPEAIAPPPRARAARATPIETAPDTEPQGHAVAAGDSSPPNDPLRTASAAIQQGRFDEAVALLRPLADAGSAPARYNLALMYASGRGVPRDVKEAFSLTLQAARAGLASAQNNLGIMYLTGQGTPMDEREALRWLNMAAANGHPLAKRNLAALIDRRLDEDASRSGAQAPAALPEETPAPLRP